MSAILKHQMIMYIKHVQHTELSFFKMWFSFNSFIFINCVPPPTPIYSCTGTFDRKKIIKFQNIHHQYSQIFDIGYITL